MNRREFSIKPIKINRQQVTKVIIDPHYEEKHAAHVNDKLVLELVKMLDGRFEVPEAEDEG